MTANVTHTATCKTNHVVVVQAVDNPVQPLGQLHLSLEGVTMDSQAHEFIQNVDCVETGDALAYHMCLRAEGSLKGEGESLGLWCQ